MSNNMPGNPYAEDALSYTGYEDIGPAVMTLAYEQRTANLIALYHAQLDVDRPAARSLLGRISVRLGGAA